VSDEHVTLPDDAPDPTGGFGDAPAAAAEPIVVHSCTECGTPIDDDQQYCLQCGAPTPAAVPLRRRGATAPVIAAALLALGVGGGALIYALTKEDDGDPVASGPTTTLETTAALPPFTTDPLTVTTSPFPTDPFNTMTTDSTDPFGNTDTTDPFGTTDTTDPFGNTDTTDPFGNTDTTDPFGNTDTTDTTDPFGNTDTTETTDPFDPDPIPDDPGGTTDDWTSGDGYTVILSSVRDRAAADRFKGRVQATGRTAGVLVSDNYSSLRPGYYAVFSGSYSTASAAKSAAVTLRRSYPGAYAQRVAA